MRPSLLLLKTPNSREQAGRRRLVVLAAFLGLALASGLVGSATHSSRDISSRPVTGPFSYIPTE
jgi:hypothetical protein